MSRILFLIYAGFNYLTFLVAFSYAIGFVTNLLVPKAIDGVPQVPLSAAIINNLTLLAIFAVQHSVMARPKFKQWWTRIIPAPIERSTYVLFSNLALILLMWKWEPMGGVIWSVSSPLVSGLLTALSLLGFAILIASTFMVDHWDLFGLRQVWAYFTGKTYTPPKFKTAYLYKYVRHPLYLGFVIGFWAAPTMTVTHLIFTVMCTGYILVGIYLEEKDLTSYFGDTYRNYKKRIPMLIPIPGRKASVRTMKPPHDQAA
ncbi:MAG: isoprenylcysteine carboxylmethyltransferase family protein [Saprospiraceae bacterium]|nr:isoprenylcysteine carboxylmethyltransferase family protein [Lewinella sp.]